MRSRRTMPQNSCPSGQCVERQQIRVLRKLLRSGWKTRALRMVFGWRLFGQTWPHPFFRPRDAHAELPSDNAVPPGARGTASAVRSAPVTALRPVAMTRPTAQTGSSGAAEWAIRDRVLVMLARMHALQRSRSRWPVRVTPRPFGQACDSSVSHPIAKESASCLP